MHITINGKNAALKTSASFDYISENRYFTGSDAYTLSIEFPLKGCPDNLEIFGFIARKDVNVPISKIRMKAEIHDRDFYRSGTLTITEINEATAKCQFLAGRAEQNYEEALSRIYINMLPLGENAVLRTATLAEMTKSYDDGGRWLYLPWLNQSAGVKNNGIINGNFSEAPNRKRSIPYLIVLAKLICEKVGYSYDFSAWEASHYRHLICCNVLPGVWDHHEQYRYALPHWTVEEFFEQLEMLLFAEFDFDNARKIISCQMLKDVIDDAGEEQLENVVDEFSSQITEEDESQYYESENLGYSARSDEYWKEEDCDWYVNEISPDNYLELYTMTAVKFYADLRTYYDIKAYKNSVAYNQLPPDDVQKLIHCQENDCYFIFKVWKCELIADSDDSLGEYKTWRHYVHLSPVNEMGKRMVNRSEEKKDTVTEIKIVPVCIMDNFSEDVQKYPLSSQGYMMALWPGDMQDLKLTYHFDTFTDQKGNVQQVKVIDTGSTTTNTEDAETYYNAGYYLPDPYNLIAQGEKEKDPEYYDKIYVAFYTGPQQYGQQIPLVHHGRVVMEHDSNNYHVFNEVLRIRSEVAGNGRKLYFKIEGTKKYTFSFLSERIPNPRAVFFIHGKKYLCKQITATFTPEGRSQLMKGEFFRIEEDYRSSLTSVST